MGSIDSSGPPSIARAATTAVLALIALASTVVFTIRAPKTGLPATGAQVIRLQNGSGAQVGYCDDRGVCAFSGSIVSHGGTVSTGSSVVVWDRSAPNVTLHTLTDSVGIGMASPKATLAVLGTMSGSLVTTTTLSGTFLRTTSVSPLVIPFIVAGTGTALTTGSGRVRLTIPKTASGFKVTGMEITVDKAGRTNATCVQLRDKQKNFRKIFNPPPVVDSTQTGSITSSVPLVITNANADVGAGDYLYVDICGVSTTSPLGLEGILYLNRP